MPLDLVLVLDKSGSVYHAQQQILAFARDLVGQFALGADAAQVGLVEFNHDAAVLIGLSASLSALEAALSGASAAGGYTSVSDGLAAGLSVLTGAGSRPGVPSALLLLTDGVQTVDGDDATAIAEASVVKAAGVQVFAVGFGGAQASTMAAIGSSPSHAYMGADMEAIREHFTSASLCASSSPCSCCTASGEILRPRLAAAIGAICTSSGTV